MITLSEGWNDPIAWDAFVDGHEQGRFCHLFAYSDVVACYGYKPARLAFRKGGQLIALLAGSFTNSVLFGRKLVSQPFSEYGGLLVDPSAGVEDMAEIYALLTAYLNRHTLLEGMELHGDHGIPPALRPGPFALQNPHEIAVLSLDRPADDLWQKVVQYSVRKGVNKAQAHDVSAVEECSDQVVRARFYPLYLKSMKRLGVPPHTIDYYTRCAALLGSRMKIFWAVREGEYLAGLLGFVSGGRVNIINIVSTRDAWQHSPNDLIHWAFIKWAADAGLKYFDFGSVRYDGQRTYKKKWGTQFTPHGYHVLSQKPAEIKVTFSSSSPRMTQLSNAWANYMPAYLAKLTGPLIRRHLVR